MGMASSIHRSPEWKSSRASTAGSPRPSMTRMPPNETIMPSNCRPLASSRSSAQDHSITNNGADALISTAFTAVVLRSPT